MGERYRWGYIGTGGERATDGEEYKCYRCIGGGGAGDKNSVVRF